MGGVDRGLQAFRGKRLVDHVYERFGAAGRGVIINATRITRIQSSASRGQRRDRRVRRSSRRTARGGSHFKRPVSRHRPLDSPFLPADLIERLYQRIDETGRPSSGGENGRAAAPGVSLVRRAWLDHLREFLKGGGRKIDGLVRDAQRG